MLLLKQILIFYIAALLLFNFSLIYTDAHKDAQASQALLSQPTATPTATPTPTPGVPMTLHIPNLQVTASVEQLGTTSDGAMDVPHNVMDVGWYKYGNRPGEDGNVVIDGHYDQVTGAPAVFYNLRDLQTNAAITLTDQEGKQYLYHVQSVTSYTEDSFPLQSVFATGAKLPMLYMITCDGIWDRGRHDYSNRLLVTAILQQ